MKIVILGLIAVAIVNVTLAAPSDKGGKDDMENETSKAQLAMVLEQMKDLRHQLRQQQEQQRLTSEQQLQMTKLMEEQQHRDEKQQEVLKEQQDQLKEQQRRDEEQQEKITKIQRTRRSENKKMRLIKKSENETVEHIKKLVLSEIKPMIDGLSECALGNYTWVNDNYNYEHSHVETTTISYGRTFSRKPKVITSVAGHWRENGEINGPRIMWVHVKSPTTTKFDMDIHIWQFYARSIEFIWIACA